MHEAREADHRLATTYPSFRHGHLALLWLLVLNADTLSSPYTCTKSENADHPNDSIENLTRLDFLLFYFLRSTLLLSHLGPQFNGH